MEEYERDSPLFDETVPVLLQLQDRDERNAELTLRVMYGWRQTSRGNKERLLHLEITDEDDGLFLFTLDVSEEEFHELKNDQKLLVDFSAFSSKFIELLNLCIQEKDGFEPADYNISTTSVLSSNIGSHHRFLAVLNNRESSGYAVFSIVEANLFKQLTHLSLKFRSGNDSTIKKYLADRLCQIKAQNKKLTEELDCCRKDLGRSKAEEQAAMETATQIKEQRELDLKQLKIDYTAKLNEEKERNLAAVEQLQARHQKEMRELQQRSDKMISELQKTVAAYEQTNKGLTEGKFNTQTTVNQLKDRLDEVTRAYERCKVELDDLRTKLSDAENTRFGQERVLNQHKLELATLQQKVRDKDEMIEKMTTIVHTAEAHKSNFDESLKLYKENYAKVQEKLEASIQEINKGNQIIQKFQNDQRAFKSKLKTKSIVLKQQELAIQEAEKHLKDLSKQISTLQSEIREKDEEIERLKTDLQSANTKLAEGNKLLQSNQQVIAWLNKEINEVQLNKSRSRTTSTPFSFRPSLSRADLTPSAALSMDEFPEEEEERATAFTTRKPTSTMASFEKYTLPSGPGKRTGSPDSVRTSHEGRGISP